MVLQNYQNFIVLTSNMVYIVAVAVGFKCPNKIHLNTQWGGGQLPLLRATGSDIPVSDQRAIK